MRGRAGVVRRAAARWGAGIGTGLRRAMRIRSSVRRSCVRSPGSGVVVREEVEREGTQVVVHLRAFGQTARGQRLLAFAREHEMRREAERRAGFEVAQRVAHHGRIGGIDLEAVGDHLQHAGLGLAAVAVVLRGVRAEEHGVDARAHGRGLAVHLRVHGVERRRVEQTASDAGLVRRDGDAIARLIQASDRFEAAGQRDPFVRRLDEGVGIDVDHAVAVEDHDLAAGAGRHGVASGWVWRMSVPAITPRGAKCRPRCSSGDAAP
ncbi:hypothetical protein PT2222_270008 [Paraburkholderia tropica]